MTPKHAGPTDQDWDAAFDDQERDRAASDYTIARAARQWYRGEITALRLRHIVAREEAKN